MAKKNLSEKITTVIIGFGVLSCLYFAIAAWLKSDGPAFNPTLTYDLLKDTLTLGAAFLAPVAAFVLFSDWREQHIAKQLDEIARETIFNVLDAFTLTYMSQFSGVGVITRNYKKQSIQDLLDMLKKNVDEIDGYILNELELVNDLLEFTKIINKLDGLIQGGVMDRPRIKRFTEDDDDTAELKEFLEGQKLAQYMMHKISKQLDQYVIR